MMQFIDSKYVLILITKLAQNSSVDKIKPNRVHLLKKKRFGKFGIDCRILTLLTFLKRKIETCKISRLVDMDTDAKRSPVQRANLKKKRNLFK